MTGPGMRFARFLSTFLGAVLCLVSCCCFLSPANAQAKRQGSSVASATYPSATAYPSARVYALRLNIPAFEITLWKDFTAVKTYPVALGTPARQTPTGLFFIASKIKYPTWIPPDGSPPVPPGPDNPLGSRWMGLDKPRYGLHSTNAPSSIGKAISLGCIRMFPWDAEELFDTITIGTPFEIVYELVDVAATADGVTVRIFRDIYWRGRPLLAQVCTALENSGMPAGDIDRLLPDLAAEISAPSGKVLAFAITRDDSSRER